MQTPVPREQVQLTAAEMHEFDALFDTLAMNTERVEEHLLDPTLVPYITR